MIWYADAQTRSNLDFVVLILTSYSALRLAWVKLFYCCLLTVIVCADLVIWRGRFDISGWKGSTNENNLLAWRSLD